MKKKYNDFTYVFHSTNVQKKLINSFIAKSNLINCGVISDDLIKKRVLEKSIFAISKSGTISLEICNAKIPSIIIYKMGFINYLIVKTLVKTKFANIINISADKEVIPELLQSNCNAQYIYKVVNEFLENPNKIKRQIIETEIILKNFKTTKLSSELISESLNKFLQ